MKHISNAESEPGWLHGWSDEAMDIYSHCGLLSVTGNIKADCRVDFMKSTPRFRLSSASLADPRHCLDQPQKKMTGFM